MQTTTTIEDAKSESDDDHHSGVSACECAVAVSRMRGYANEEQWLSEQWHSLVSKEEADAPLAHPLPLKSLIMIVIRVALIHHCRRRRGGDDKAHTANTATEKGDDRNCYCCCCVEDSQCIGLCTKPKLQQLPSALFWVSEFCFKMRMSQFPFESIKGQVYIALHQHKVEHLFQLNSGSGATSRLELAYSGFANAIRAIARRQRHCKDSCSNNSSSNRQGYLFKLI